MPLSKCWTSLYILPLSAVPALPLLPSSYNISNICVYLLVSIRDSSPAYGFRCRSIEDCTRLIHACSLMKPFRRATFYMILNCFRTKISCSSLMLYAFCILYGLDCSPDGILVEYFLIVAWSNEQFWRWQCTNGMRLHYTQFHATQLQREYLPAAP